MERVDLDALQFVRFTSAAWGQVRSTFHCIVGVSMQSKRFTISIRKPAGVGLALVAVPQVSFEKRHAGERRPYI